VPLQLQTLEAEHLDASNNKPLANGNFIRGGIEFNRLGQRVAYHLYREHPGDAMLFGASKETVRVPAEEVLHIFKPQRPGQIRGEPWLGRVLLKLYELDQYDDAELVRKKTAAMFAGFITKNDPDTPFMGEDSRKNDFNAHEPLSEDAAGFLQAEVNLTVIMIVKRGTLMHSYCYWKNLRERGTTPQPTP
jgi:lambda family phage portal protein